MRTTRTLLAMGSAIALVACGDAASEVGNVGGNELAQAQRPGAGIDHASLATGRDGNVVNLSGRVVSAQPDFFLLDYGLGEVRVEMDDWDWYQEGKLLKAGDEVVVRGRIDNDFVARKRIEASSVFVKNLGTYFYASASDEEALPTTTVFVSTGVDHVDATGTVTAIEGREFTMGAASGPLRVDTTALPENPLDGKGFQQVKVGDRLYVWGDLNLEQAEGAELKARGIVTLAQDRKKAAAPATQQAAEGS